MSLSRPSIAIIGGGLAGLSAALALREASAPLDITLYESKRSTGGRAASFLDPQTGESVDYCQHVAMGCCTNLLSMMESVGLGESFTRHRELMFFHRDHRPARFGRSRLLPAPFHLLPSLIGFPYLTWKQRYEIARATFALMRARSADLLTTTAHDWLAAQRQSPQSIRDYWEIVIASALGESHERVSMAAARKVFVDGFLASRQACEVLVPKVPLAELFGNEVPKAVAGRRVNVQTATMVRSVEPCHGGSMRVELERAHVIFDHVILAVPSHRVGKLLSPKTAIAAGLPADRFEKVPCSPITGVHLWFDQPILDRPHAVLVGTLAQWVFRRDPEHCIESGGHYAQVVISASHRLREIDSQQLIGQVVRELQHAFPMAATAKLIRSRIVSDPLAVFSLRPEVDALRPAARTALPCLHLAGDFVQTGWPATMEGAVISGRMAASSLLEHLGRPPVLISPGLPRSLLSRWLIRP